MFNGLQFFFCHNVIHCAKILFTFVVKHMHSRDWFPAWFKFTKNFFLSPLCTRQRHELGNLLWKETFMKFSYVYIIILSIECFGLFTKGSTCVCKCFRVALYRRYISRLCLWHYYRLQHLLLIYFEHYLQNLTLYVPCVVTNYVNKPTRRTFSMYLFYNFCTTLHVSNDRFVHHQEFMIYCISSSVQTMQMHVVGLGHVYNSSHLYTDFTLSSACLHSTSF